MSSIQVVFLFEQKTAYDMRISDWSSDVCSSDLLGVWQFKWELEDLAFRYLQPEDYRRVASMVAQKRSERERYVKQLVNELQASLRSEERRVGKEGVSKCRSGW